MGFPLLVNSQCSSIADTLVQFCPFLLHSDFSIASENAIKPTEDFLLYKYAILRSPKNGGLETQFKEIFLWTYVVSRAVVLR